MLATSVRSLMSINGTSGTEQEKWFCPGDLLLSGAGVADTWSVAGLTPSIALLLHSGIREVCHERFLH